MEPNDWERELTDEESLTASERGYKHFFDELVEAYAARRPNWYALTPGTRGYMTFSAGISRVSFGWVFHQGPEFSVELYISTSEKERNEAMFEALQDARAEIDSSLDVDLVW